ncbi:MAG: NUDIX domain-containing protein [Beutenbergiaceae bacterium]
MTVPEPPVADSAALFPVLHRRRLGSGRLFDLVCETVDLGPAGQVDRDYLEHPGAVAILALDESDRVLLIRQYRHPVRSYLWEIPAGLLDVPGETLVEAARRELLEEADLRASHWHTLADFYTSPGASNEALRVFLARGLSQVPVSQRHVRTAEEQDMQVHWLPLAEAVDLVLRGAIGNPSAVVAVLAANAARSQQWGSLRAVDADWVR